MFGFHPVHNRSGYDNLGWFHICTYTGDLFLAADRRNLACWAWQHCRQHIQISDRHDIPSVSSRRTLLYSQCIARNYCTNVEQQNITDNDIVGAFMCDINPTMDSWINNSRLENWPLLDFLLHHVGNNFSLVDLKLFLQFSNLICHPKPEKLPMNLIFGGQ